MSAGGQWMKFYVGDYLRDTQHLTAPEHGAYLLLLMSLWSRGSLPDEARVLRTIARCTPKQWATVWPIIRPLFTIDNGHVSQGRVDRERQAIGLGHKGVGGRPRKAPVDRSAQPPAPPAAPPVEPSNGRPKASTNGRRGESIPPKQVPEKPQKAETESQSQREREKENQKGRKKEVVLDPTVAPNPSLSHSPRVRAAAPASATLPGVDLDPQPKPPPGNVIAFQTQGGQPVDPFEAFWLLYPRKTAKGDARTAWKKAIAKHPAAAIVEALRQRAPHFSPEPRYVPHPATWLNQERWSDEIDSLRAVANSQPESAAEQSMKLIGMTPADIATFLGEPSRERK